MLGGEPLPMRGWRRKRSGATTSNDSVTIFPPSFPLPKLSVASLLLSGHLDPSTVLTVGVRVPCSGQGEPELKGSPPVPLQDVSATPHKRLGGLKWGISHSLLSCLSVSHLHWADQGPESPMVTPRQHLGVNQRELGPAVVTFPKLTA